MTDEEKREKRRKYIRDNSVRFNRRVKERNDMKIKAIKAWEFRKKRGFK